MTHFNINEEQTVRISSETVFLDGLLYIPENPCGLVLFVHGSGSSRFSIRNQYVARVLNEGHIATLLFDLLTPDEEAIDSRTRQFRFDIEFLASRLLDATTWCLNQPILKFLPIGYFGASTGGGAALVAAAIEPEMVQAVVSRGGRPDLAGDSLTLVRAPTLLIAGGCDDVVIQMNKDAMAKLNGIKKMEIIPGATHLFEEPGTLEEVARMAKTWFVSHLKAP